MTSPSYISQPPVELLKRILQQAHIGTMNLNPSVPAKQDFFASGSRNTNYTSFAGGLRRKGLNQDQIGIALRSLQAASTNALSSEESDAIAGSVSRYQPVVPLTEQSVASIFADRYANNVRFSRAHGWMFFDGMRWVKDTLGVHVQEAAKNLLNEMHARLEDGDGWNQKDSLEMMKVIVSMQKGSRIKGIISLARSEGLLLDLEPWSDAHDLLNFQNGTLDMKTMRIRDHDPVDRLRNVLNIEYNPDETCPNFDAFMADILSEDEADFLMQTFGQALSGNGGRQKMLVILGPGLNGKSTFIELMGHVFGPYSGTIEPTTLMKSAFKSGINDDIADLDGTRLVTTTELNVGQTMDAAFVKRLTGGDTIKVRHLYERFFPMEMIALPVLVSNFAPVFDGSDTAMARRLQVINFDRLIPASRVNSNLPALLRSEAAGVMNRLLSGYQRYLQAGSIEAPASVDEATSLVVKDSNQVMQFLEAMCNVKQGSTVRASDMYWAYKSWAGFEGGVSAMSQPAFKGAMQRTLKITQKRSGSSRLWPDLELKNKH